MARALVGAILLTACFTVVTYSTFAQGNSRGSVADTMVVAVVWATWKRAIVSHKPTVAFAFTVQAFTMLALFSASFVRAGWAGPAISAYALTKFIAIGGNCQFALTVRVVAVFWACLESTVFACEPFTASAGKRFFVALTVSGASIWALAYTAIVTLEFRVALTLITDAHSVATARVGARWEFARFASPHVRAQADAIFAFTVAVTVLWASFFATVFSSPAFLAGALKSFGIAFSVGLGSALVGALLLLACFSGPSWLTFA